MLVDAKDFASPELLPFGRAREVDIACACASLEDRRHHNVLTKHELIVDAMGAFVVLEVQHEGPSVGRAVRAAFFHQGHLVVCELDVDLDELFEEENVFVAVVNLDLSCRNV